jgi:hypothetical protein
VRRRRPTSRCSRATGARAGCSAAAATPSGRTRAPAAPSAANQDRETLGYFGTGDAAHRLYVCDRCNRYLKTLDLRATWRRPLLPAERVLAVGMDLAAARAGYHA